MDDLFGEINCRSKSDSIVMRLLRSAMDEAHEKVQSQNGPIEFLHERSKFYELATILVDGGLNIVEEEADIQETSRQKMLSDLTEIKDWLQRRLEEMRNLIIEKDKELMERVENELKLRRALDFNERELVFLREKLERTQSEDLMNFIQSNQEIEDEAQGGNIGELKNSVDQQVSNIKQKLEDERKSLISKRRIRGRTSRSSDSELFSKLFDEDRQSGSGWMEDENFRDNQFLGIKSLKNSFNPGKNNVMIQQMSSDIDILKGTLDLAFGRMQTAEMFPLEKQWRWSIEKDIIVFSVKGFINDVGQIFKLEFEKSGGCIPFGFSRKKWSELINDVRDLHDELNALCNQGKVEEKISSMHELSAPPASVQQTNSEPIPEVFSKVLEKDSDPSGSHYVAKMVKNHESFIQKQRECEEWNWLAREILRRKGSSTIKRDKDPDELETRIQKAITRLDNLIRWDDKFGVDRSFCDDNSSMLEASITKIDGAVTEKINDGNGADLRNAIRELKQERDELELQSLITEEVYLLLFGGFAKSLDLKLFKDKNENLIIGDSHGLSTNDAEDDHGVTTDNLHNEKSGELGKEFLQHYLEISAREDVLAVYFQETVLEWNNNMESNADDLLVKEEIWRIVFSESMDGIVHSSNMVISRLQMDIERFETLLVNLPCSSMLPETVGSLLKEDIYIVYFRELFNAWRAEIDACYVEILIKENIYQFVMVEMVKESYVNCGQSKISEQMKFSKDFPSPMKLRIYEEENSIESSDSCYEHHEEEETVSTSGPTKEDSERCLEVAEGDSIKLLSNDDVRIGEVSEKLETSFDRLLKYKALVLDMQCNSGRTLEDQKEYDLQAQVHPIEEVESERQHSYSQPEENEMLQHNLSVFSHLKGFHEVLMDFQHMVHKKLEFNYLRVRKLQHQINALAQPAASIRKKKFLYKKAFITRCHNLRLAETEVDLLGNQVDKLICLLQDIYLILQQNSTVLSQYFGVFDMLKLIKELTEGAACMPNIDS